MPHRSNGRGKEGGTMKPKTKIIVAISIACLIIGLVVLDVVLSKKQTQAAENTGTNSTVATDTNTGPTLNWDFGNNLTVTPGTTTPGTNSVAFDPGSPDFGKSELTKTDTKNTGKVDALDPVLGTGKPDAKKPTKGLMENTDAFAGTGKEYEIQPGDSFSSISKKFFGTEAHWQTIAKANPNMKPEALRVGKKITIPDAPAKVKFDSTKQTVKKGEREVFDGGKSYIVQSGDSLWTIASKNYKNNEVAMMIKKIVALNPDKLKNENTTLKVGWKLVLP